MPKRSPRASALARGDAPNLVPIKFGEPEVAIRAGRDAQRLTARGGPTGRGQGGQGGAASGGDAPDAIRKGRGEPRGAIGPGREATRARGRGGDRGGGGG